MENNNINYKLANLGEKDYNYFKNIESKLKAETGRDLILILWEKAN